MKTSESKIDLKAASKEYETAYREYEAATRMNVATPERVGTFGGAWECDQERLLRSLPIALRLVAGKCSPAIDAAIDGQDVVIVDGNYIGLEGAPPADLYRMANGGLRDPDGRYLEPVECDALKGTIGEYGSNPVAYGSRPFAKGSSMTFRRDPERRPDQYYSPGRLIQRLAEHAAYDANSLTKPYVTGWPANWNDAKKADAFQRVAKIYRQLLAAWEEAGQVVA